MKLSVTVALISLLVSIPTWWFVIPVAAMTSRELFVSGLREWMATRGLRSQVKVGSLGKWKTAFQMTSLVLLLHSSYALPPLALARPLAYLLHQQSLFSAGVLCLYVSTVLSLLSAGQYLIAAWPSLMIA
jgi:CDP-diacylglycerol---glycerol-3-phosphate 3-phosphatidyltransferase